MALVLGALLAAGWAVGARWFGWGVALQGYTFGRSAPQVLVAGTVAGFLVLRPLTYLWRYWAGLRRRRLIWAMTHMQVQIVLLFVLLGAALMLLVFVLEGRVPPPGFEGEGAAALADTLIATVVPVLGIAIALFFGVLLFVLPPTALISYFLSRRVTNRVEALATAATALRQGDTSARVKVQGEDELAQLQSDFNAMAGEMEQTMRDLQSERDKVSQLLDDRRQLVASVSHELRTPVATLRGYLDSTRDSREDLVPEDLAGDLAVMDGEVGRLQVLIDDLFTLSQADLQELSLDLGPVEVGAVVQRRVAAVAPLAWVAGRVQVSATVAPGLPQAHADAARLEQVLGNLLRNGVRHTGPGGIVLVEAYAETDGICIQVRDTGEGIHPADLEHIFEPFYRGRGSERSEPRGAGLGLAIVKDLVESMGGSVSVSSRLGEGSTFIVKLPKA
jgi:signal transduction histidine kinase